jgi:hypothetical protein
MDRITLHSEDGPISRPVAAVNEASTLSQPPQKSVQPTTEEISVLIARAKEELADLGMPPPADASSAEHEKYAGTPMASVD